MIARLQKARDEREGGFTLIELLVVIIIIGILAAIAIPVFLNQRTGAQDSAAQSVLTQTALAEQSYFQTNNSYLAAADAAAFEPLVDLGATLLNGTTAPVIEASGTGSTAVFCAEITSDSSAIFHVTQGGGPAVDGACP